jgi:hypothetical protein
MSLSEAQQSLATFKPKRRKGFYTSVVLTRTTRDKLRQLKHALGFRTYDALFTHLMLENAGEGSLPFADYETVFVKEGSKPVVLTGETGAGKTMCVKGLLSRCGDDDNIFILDVSDEYDGKKVDLGQFFAVQWTKPGQRLRFVPSKDEEISRIEASNVFRQLIFLMHRGVLKGWTLVVEEGHRFSEDKALRTLLEEARKFTKKLIVVSTDWEVYRGICPVVRPPPWEQAPSAAPTSP